MKIQVAPSILSADFAALGDGIRMIEAAGADLVHVDVMDGHFVTNISFGIPVVKCARKATKMPFDVHLMIENPDKYIEAFADAGADIITVHQEACVHLHRTIQMIRKLNLKAAVALNPATPISTLECILPELDMVLLMSVNPGFGGQSYIKSTTRKIAALRKMADAMGCTNLDIEVDGGIDTVTYKEVREAGANILVAGSAVFGAADPKAVITTLKS